MSLYPILLKLNIGPDIAVLAPLTPEQFEAGERGELRLRDIKVVHDKPEVDTPLARDELAESTALVVNCPVCAGPVSRTGTLQMFPHLRETPLGYVRCKASGMTLKHAHELAAGLKVGRR